MSLNKLQKFAAIKTMSHVFQNFSFNHPQLICNETPVTMRGKWHESFFKNSNPIVLELACGRGEYTVNLARKNPNINYIGIDVKGNRIYTGAQTAIDEGLQNVAFIRTPIEQLHHFIAPDEASEIWITFPDPFPKFPDRKNRLISPRFIDLYRSHFATKPIIYHLKTDNIRLFRYATGVIDGRGYKIHTCLEDIYAIDKKIEDYLRIQTYYERLHQGMGSAIHYMKWEM